MSNNSILTLENVVLTLLSQTECDLQKIREYFDKVFAEGNELDVQDFQKAYMYTFKFTPNKELGNQRLIYRCIESRLSTEKTKYLGLMRLRKVTADSELTKKLDRAITALEVLPGMIY